jgi:hypothetical protein
MDLNSAFNHLQKTFPNNFEKIMPLQDPDAEPADLKTAYDVMLQTRNFSRDLCSTYTREDNPFYYDVCDAATLILESFDTARLPAVSEEDKKVAAFTKRLEAIGAINPTSYAAKFHKAIIEKDLTFLHPILAQNGSANSVSKREFTLLTGITLEDHWRDIETQLFGWAGNPNTATVMREALSKAGCTDTSLKWAHDLWTIVYRKGKNTLTARVRTVTELEVHITQPLPQPNVPTTPFEKYLATLSPLMAGKARHHLEKKENHSGLVRSRKDFAEEAAREGWELKHYEDWKSGKVTPELYLNGTGFHISKTTASYFSFVQEIEKLRMSSETPEIKGEQ